MERFNVPVEVHLSEHVEKRPYVEGGPLMEDRFLFEQMHFHWGPTDGCGSENHVDGVW